MIKKIEMYVFKCTACENTESRPVYSQEWLPTGWEEETWCGVKVHYCPFHKYGLRDEEIVRVNGYVVANR
jgi:hypothetical protein